MVQSTTVRVTFLCLSKFNKISSILKCPFDILKSQTPTGTVVDKYPREHEGCPMDDPSSLLQIMTRILKESNLEIHRVDNRWGIYPVDKED